MWLIYIPWHFPFQFDENIQGASDKAERAFKEQYPAVFSHMLQYKEQLSKRNKAETGIRYEWYAMQRWGAKYWEDFSKPKIMYSEIVRSPQFYLDEQGRISSAVLLRSSSVWQLAKISLRFAVLMIKASLQPVSTPR